MSQSKTVPVNTQAAEMVQELFTVLFCKKFGREPGPDDPVVCDPHAATPQRLTDEKHAHLLADMGSAAGLPPHFVHAMRQTGFIVKRATKALCRYRKLNSGNAPLTNISAKPLNPIL